VTIIGEQPIFQRKLNKKGKPVGKPALTGYRLDFSTALNASAAANRANYEIATLTTKRVKKTVKRILHPIPNFTVSYSPTDHSVTLKLAGKQTFPTGGEIMVLPGVTSASGGTLEGTTVFNIAKGGKKID
jgi:hypothetical protein